MPGVSRAGVDNVNGGIIMTGNSSVLCNGSPVATVGSSVSSHVCCGVPGCDSHCFASMVSGSPSVKVGGIAVCRAGDSASCGHVATGSNNINIG